MYPFWLGPLSFPLNPILGPFGGQGLSRGLNNGGGGNLTFEVKRIFPEGTCFLRCKTTTTTTTYLEPSRASIHYNATGPQGKCHAFPFFLKKKIPASEKVYSLCDHCSQSEQTRPITNRGEHVLRTFLHTLASLPAHIPLCNKCSNNINATVFWHSMLKGFKVIHRCVQAPMVPMAANRKK
jgi:hypothetical protein